jgi:hypothetical protein
MYVSAFEMARSQQRLQGIGTCPGGKNRTAGAARTRYMNVPSGSPFSITRPTASKCASRDWICCDSVWMSRKRRSKGVPRKIAEVPAAL